MEARTMSMYPQGRQRPSQVSGSTTRAKLQSLENNIRKHVQEPEAKESRSPALDPVDGLDSKPHF